MRKILPLLALVLFVANGCVGGLLAGNAIIWGAVVHEPARKPASPTTPAMINEELEAMGLPPLASDVESQK